jgi:hypothetical protein
MWSMAAMATEKEVSRRFKRVKSRLDRRRYELGAEVTDNVKANLNIERAEFHGESNYKLCPMRDDYFANS